MCEQPDELDGRFIPALDDTNFLWTGKLFIAREPLDGIAKRAP
jgi:hypothetical protein